MLQLQNVVAGKTSTVFQGKLSNIIILIYSCILYSNLKSTMHKSWEENSTHTGRDVVYICSNT